MTYASEVAADGPYLYWKLDETTGVTTAADSSGNSRPGTVNGTVDRATAPDGTSNAAFLFDASADNVISGSSFTSPTTVSFECWAYVPTGAITASTAILAVANGANAPRGTLFIDTAGRLQFYHPSLGNMGDIKVARDRWVHLVVTAGASGGTRLYIDSQVYATNGVTTIGSVGSATFRVHGTGQLFITEPDAAPATMRIAHAALYTTELSAARITAHFTAMSVVNGASTTPALVYEEYVETLVTSIPSIRVYEEYVETLVLSKPSILVYEEYVETVVRQPAVGGDGVPLALTVTMPAGLAGPFQPAQVNGPAMALTLTAQPFSFGRPMPGVVIPLTVAMPAGTVEAFTVDRSGDAITLTLLTDVVDTLPGSILAQVGLGTPSAVAYFFLDGSTTAFASTALDVDGSCLVSLSVNNLAAGAHTLKVSNSSSAASPFSTDTFTVTNGVIVDPQDPPVTPPSPPTPGPTVLYWTFRDYVDTTELYTFPSNPSEMDTPPAETPLSAQSSTSPAGTDLLFEGTPNPPVWRFRGSARTQAEVEALQYWSGKQQRVYITDHYGRRFTVKMNTLTLNRVRDVMRTWHHNYEFTVTILKIEAAP